MPPVVGEHEHKAQIRPQAMMSEHGNEARLPLAAVAPAPEPAPLLLPRSTTPRWKSRSRAVSLRLGAHSLSRSVIMC